jgi:KUP system potassium uptake protein
LNDKSQIKPRNEFEHPPKHVHGRRLYLLSLTALGVVYGDIGTSPLYAIRECFHGEYGIEPNPHNILGVLSLMVWALLIVVSLKYLTFILRADNNGEGGVIALTSLVRSHIFTERGKRWFLVGLGLFGASLLYGDGMITPAISVLSAVEGLRIITPVFQPYIIPVTCVILALLFLLQRRGTAGVGRLFGPITLLWFGIIGVLGIRQIVQNPSVLSAVNPWHGVSFLATNHLHGFLVLGAVFLVVTGAEALYADMGHFGRRPIRLAWFAVVLPALLSNYFGQGALLLVHPEAAHHPFYALVPGWSLIPMVILATAATIIASQAVISGAFSLTRQAIQIGYLPRLQIVHTSATEMGQIYVPQVNWMLMVATIGLVIGFQTSSKLAAAYGVAVTTTMLIATMLFYVVARQRWRWSRLTAGIPVALFLIVDLAFFGANIIKITHGAWFPLVIGAASFTLMTTWKKGRDLLADKMRQVSEPIEGFLRRIAEEPPARVPGKAVFMSGNPGVAPLSLQHNLTHNKILHSEVAILSIAAEELPRVPREEKVEVTEIGQGFYKVSARFGFMEEPNVPYVLALAREKGLDFELADTSFFLGRERFLPGKTPGMRLWRSKIFAFMSRNAVGATAFFRIPPEQVIELGAQIEI